MENCDEKCISEWMVGKLDCFSSFLDVPLEGLEDEANELFCLIEERRLKAIVVGSMSVDCKRLQNKLKRLDCGIHYERSIGLNSDEDMWKGKGIFRS